MIIPYFAIWHPDHGYFLSKSSRDPRMVKYTFGYDGAPTIFKTEAGAYAALRQMPEKVRPGCIVQEVKTLFQNNPPADNGEDLLAGMEG